MSICDNCIHNAVCGLEDCHEEAIKFCSDMVSKYKYKPKGEPQRQEGGRMIKKLGELTINKSSDYYDDVAKALEEAGYVLVLEYETTFERHYIVAKEE